VQEHTLGEVGNLGTFWLRVSSGTILPILLKSVHIWETRSKKISWHSFFCDTVYMRKSPLPVDYTHRLYNSLYM